MSYSTYKPSEEETNALRRRVLARMLAIYSEVNEWIEKTWAKHRVNLVAFAENWVENFFDDEDSWPTTHRKKNRKAG